MNTSRRDCRPVGGVWQGVNPQTKSVASVVWVARSAWQPAMLFLEIDGKTMASPGREPDEEILLVAVTLAQLAAVAT